MKTRYTRIMAIIFIIGSIYASHSHAYGMNDDEDADLVLQNNPWQINAPVPVYQPRCITTQYEDPLNAYRVPNELYAPNWRQLNINGRSYICDFSGRIANCGEQ